MTESEYRDSALAIDATGIHLGAIHIMPSAEQSVIQADVRRLCDDHKPTHVLELGFGLGYSAEAFQKHGLASHCIIEAHPVIADHARRWAYDRAGVVIVEGFAQRVRVDGAWDLVFDDRYDLTGVPLDRSRFVYRHWHTCGGYGLEQRV